MEDEREQTNAQEQTQEPETDWKALARKWEKRAKENAEKARAFDEGTKDADKAQKQVEELVKELSDLKAQNATNDIRAKVSKETGVPQDLIRGDTEEEMQEFAQSLTEWAKPKSAPRVKSPGKFSSEKENDDAKRDLARQLFGA